MAPRPSPAFWIATGLGSGLSPKAPGTTGSLAALLVGVALAAAAPWLLWLGIAVAIAAGFWAVPQVAGRDEDPGFVVIDEWAGQFIALAALQRLNWLGVLAAFALFRLLDITKPGPVGWADRQGGAFGIMMDDVIAGLFAALILGAMGHWRLL